jgi:hypothetical protein
MRRHTTGVLAVIPVLLLALSACGGGGAATEDVASVSGGGGSSASPSSSAPTGDPEDQALKFARCMREHGVDMPDPDAEGRVRLRVDKERDAEKVDKAMKACEKYSPKVGGKGTREMSKEDQDKLLAFARCMREHGIDMPDPDFSGGGGFVKQRLGGKVRPDDPKFKEADKACQDKLPARPGGGPGGRP